MVQNFSHKLGNAHNEILIRNQQREKFVNFTQSLHVIDKTSKEANQKVEAEVESQVIIVVGNNDLPWDYTMTEWDPWARELHAMWTPHIIPPTEENKDVSNSNNIFVR